MQFPSVFVTSQFLDEMDKYWKRYKDSSSLDFDDEINEKIESLKRIRTLFLTSDFKTDINPIEIKNFKEDENLEFNSFKHFLLRKLVMNNNVGEKPIFSPDHQGYNFDQISCSYFLSQSNKQCNDYLEKYGKIVLGKSFLDKPFYLSHSFSLEATTNHIPQASRIAHPCSSLLILDPYLFSNKNGKAAQKANNLIRFLKDFVPKNLKRVFEIDIITLDTDRRYIKALNDLILRELQVKFSLHVYFPGKGVYSESDRYFITEYSITAIGHPLDRASYISSTFIPSNNSVQQVQKGMELWYQKINSVKKMIDKLNSKAYGPSFYWKSEEIENSDVNRESQNFSHRLFSIK